jgi:hypothetical protein
VVALVIGCEDDLQEAGLARVVVVACESARQQQELVGICAGQGHAAHLEQARTGVPHGQLDGGCLFQPDAAEVDECGCRVDVGGRIPEALAVEGDVEGNADSRRTVRVELVLDHQVAATVDLGAVERGEADLDIHCGLPGEHHVRVGAAGGQLGIGVQAQFVDQVPIVVEGGVSEVHVTDVQVRESRIAKTHSDGAGRAGGDRAEGKAGAFEAGRVETLLHRPGDREGGPEGDQVVVVASPQEAGDAEGQGHGKQRGARGFLDSGAGRGGSRGRREGSERVHVARPPRRPVACCHRITALIFKERAI